MDEIELEYENMAAVPPAFAKLYAEKDGKAVLQGVKGLKTQKDVDTVMESLRKERNDHGTLKNSLKAWEGLNAEEVRKQLEELPALRLAAEGNLDDEKIKKLIEPKVAQATGPLTRQIQTLTEERDSKDKVIADLQVKIEARDRNDVVRSVATEMKAHATAIPDIELLAGLMFEKDQNGKFVTKDGVGVTPGMDVKGWLKDMQKQRPHWWPESSGGGAGGGGGRGTGGGGANPWKAGQFNLTEQGRIVREQGMEVASRMAKEAGTSVGGLEPRKAG